MEENRVIGAYQGQQKGPLIICIGGVHGNEPAGVQALELVFKMLDVEPITNSQFNYKGRIVGLRGNLQALDTGARFITEDLNRIWTTERVNYVKSVPLDELLDEEFELRMLIDTIEREIKTYQPEEVYFLDLHTTTAYGGIFSLATENDKSVEIAKGLYAPVVLGMMKGIKGTTMHYFNEKNLKVPITGIVFESGQHTEVLSVNRAVAGIINLLRASEAVSKDDVENVHDELLIAYSANLPKVVDLLYSHKVEEGDKFVMNPDYKNFQRVELGEVLAHDENGAITAPNAGLILMPLYQPQGEDGFFIVEARSNPEKLKP